MSRRWRAAAALVFGGAALAAWLISGTLESTLVAVNASAATFTAAYVLSNTQRGIVSPETVRQSTMVGMLAAAFAVMYVVDLFDAIPADVLREFRLITAAPVWVIVWCEPTATRIRIGRRAKDTLRAVEGEHPEMSRHLDEIERGEGDQ